MYNEKNQEGKMKNYLLVCFLVSVLAVMPASAMVPEIIGGVRDGLAIGLMADSSLGKYVGMRVGVEGNSGKNPLIAFLGLKFALTNIGSSPLAFGIGGVGYFGGSKSNLGIAISVILNRAFGVPPMFVEGGIDAVEGGGKVQLQVGYKIY